MTKKIIIISLAVLILMSGIPSSAFAVTSVPVNWGSDVNDINESLNVVCSTGFAPYLNSLGKIVCALKKVLDWIKSFGVITKIAGIAGKVYKYVGTVNRVRSYLSYIPQSLPFGGHIESSERACDFHFRSVTWIKTPAPPPIPYLVGPVYVPVDVPLGGRAIVVGPPVPTYNYGHCGAGAVCDNGTVGPCVTDKDCGSAGDGKIITFPWVSKIYKHHSESRVGPWALGLMFTPFPLDDLNAELKSIRIWIPDIFFGAGDLFPCLGATTYGAVYAAAFSRSYGPIAECLDDWQFDCKSSGATYNGRPIYKVIRLLGTSP